MSKIRKRIGAALLSAMMVLVLAPAPAYAATKTVKNIPGSTKVPTAMKKATKVKKGTTTLKFKKGTGVGMVKFKATKTKTYTFTMSSLTSGAKYTIGMVQLNKQKSSTSIASSSKVKISGVGKRSIVPIVSESMVQLAASNGKTSYTSGGKTYKYLSKTSFKIKLKKGQTIYLLTQFRDSDNTAVAAKMKLKIK